MNPKSISYTERHIAYILAFLFWCGVWELHQTLLLLNSSFSLLVTASGWWELHLSDARVSFWWENFILLWLWVILRLLPVSKPVDRHYFYNTENFSVAIRCPSLAYLRSWLMGLFGTEQLGGEGRCGNVLALRYEETLLSPEWTEFERVLEVWKILRDFMGW